MSSSFRALLLLCFLLLAESVHSQIFIPFGFNKYHRTVAIRCESGCYPTPSTPFTASTYYVPVNDSVTFKAISLSNPANHDFCFGPTDAGGCNPDPIGAGDYPLQCSGPGNGDMDGSGSANGDDADYTAPATVTTDTCHLIDFNEGRFDTSFAIQTFNPVTITSPLTTSGSPQNVCVGQTQVINATGGLGTLNWAVAVGAGGVAPATGASTTYTAPAAPSTVEVTATDSTTSYVDRAYINVINTISLSPTGTIETPVNSNSFMQDPTTSAGTPYVYNLNITANCGLQNYTAACINGGSVNPTAGITNLQNVRFSPASADSTSTITFTDSTAPTPQTASLTIKNIVPTDVVSSWSYHVCVKYSHSSYAAGTYKLKCWGYNNNGQLGYGDTNARGNVSTEIGRGLPFVKDTGTTGADMLIKDVALGFNHTCVIRSDDTVKCWGLNTSGQLGYDDTTNRTSPDAATVNTGAGTPKKLYGGGHKTCLVFSDDRMKCWGRNTDGELGQDNTTSYGSNNGAASMTGLGYISVAGANVTVLRAALTEKQTCVLTTASFVPGPQRVYCWGDGNTGGGCSSTGGYCGELGKATTTNDWGNGTNLMSALTAVNLGTGGTETPIDIAAGRKHVCAIIGATTVSTSGQPICWGYNSNGQLGINNTNNIGDNETPSTRVPGITNVKRMELMARSTCAILTTDDVKCWGRGTNAQLLGSNNTGTGGGGYAVNLGDDGSPNVSATVNASFGTGRTVKKLATGFYFGCAILDNNFIKCWGAQYCGTGTNTTNNGCLLSGVSNTLDNGAGAPTMMDSRYVGDASTEVGDNLPYVNH